MVTISKLVNKRPLFRVAHTRCEVGDRRVVLVQQQYDTMIRRILCLLVVSGHWDSDVLVRVEAVRKGAQLL